jgi:hypothetical protein
MSFGRSNPPANDEIEPVPARPRLLGKLHIGGGGYVVDANPEKPIFRDLDWQNQKWLLLSQNRSIEIISTETGSGLNSHPAGAWQGGMAGR